MSDYIEISNQRLCDCHQGYLSCIEAIDYLKNPNTRVYVERNCELGEWRYTIIVCNSNVFWFNSFKTKEERNKSFRTKNGWIK